jgi:hypothetical protein
MIWIDFICIDQINLLERAEQVEMMGEIYTKAVSVLVFLGTMHRKSCWYATIAGGL